MNKMIASLVAAVMAFGASAAALTDITWVGAAGADLATKTNWDPQPTNDLSDSSGNAYRLVFSGNATPIITRADKVYCGEIQVTAGDVKITRTITNGRFIINNTTHDADYAATKMVIDVAEGATLQIGESGTTVNLNNSPSNRIYVKSGKGKLTLYGNSNYLNVGWEIEGVFESVASSASGSSIGNAGVIKVYPSSTFRLLGSNLSQTAVVDLAEDAVLDLNGCSPTLWAVTGVGTVKNGSLTLLLTHGPYLFAGRFEATTLTLRRHGTGESKKTTEDEFGFILGNAETLAAPGGNVGIEYDSSVTDKTLSDPSKCAIRFAPGIGEFYCPTNKVITRPYNGYPIWCADTDGNPVTVHAVLKSQTEKYQYFTGPGSLVAHITSDSSSKTTTLTNDIVKVKGTLAQAEAARTLVLGNGTAAQDFDFSNPAAIEAKAGTITFNNASSVNYAGTLFGSGAFVFNQGATIGSLYLNLGRLTTKGDLTTNGGRSAIEYGADGMHMDAPGLTWTVNGGSIMGDRADNSRYEMRYAPLPRGFLPSGSGKGSATLVLNGGDVTIRDNYTYGLKTYQLNGGRLHLAHARALLPDPSAEFTKENPHAYVFNGGEVVVSGREGLADSSKVCDTFPDDERLVLEIGDGGASLDDEYIYSGVVFYKPGIELNKRLTTTGAGGLRQRGYMGWRYKYPLPISGTFEGEGSCSCVPADVAAPGSYFGFGDMILRNHQLIVSGRTADYAFTPHGVGKKLTVGGGSLLALRESAKDGHATVAINELAFEPGGALFLLDFNDVGTGSTVSLATAPSTSASGRVRLPVFGVPRAWNVALPLKYDGTDGFKVFATEDYNTTDFTAGGVFYMSNTRTLTSTPETPFDMLIVSHGGSLTLSDNVQLTVGDGNGGPSVLSIGVAQIVGGQNAALSFNNAPGMIVCATSSGDSVFECSSSVQVPIKDADGLSVVSLPDIENYGWRGVRLGTANTYSGVTRVGSAIIQAEHPNCFSTGDVYTIPGKCYGGGIRLTCEGGVWNNNFHLSGQGIRSRKWDKAEFCETGFALGFSRNGEIAGNVSIDRFARLTTSTNPVVGKISGVVSGGMLEIYQTKGAIRLLNDNTYTGGTYVVDSTLELGCGTSAGTGDIWLSHGTLRFVNDEPIVFSNYVYGVGEIEIAGAPVTFVDHSFAKLPIKTLAKGSVIGFTTGYAWGDAADVAASTLKSVVIVDGDTALDGDVTVDTIWGNGTISGGAVTVTGAVDPNGTLTFAETPVLAGATLTVRTNNGTVDKVVVPGDLDLTGLRLCVEQIGKPVVFAAKAFLETSGELSGSFASVTLPAERTKNYSVDVGSTAATLTYLRPGGLLIIR